MDGIVFLVKRKKNNLKRKSKMPTCKSCNATFDFDDLDFIYPVKRDKSTWSASCPCCSMFVNGSSKEEVLEKWNQIDEDFIKNFWEEEDKWRHRHNYPITF